MDEVLAEYARQRPLDTEADWIAAGNEVGMLEFREMVELRDAGDGCHDEWARLNSRVGAAVCRICNDTPVWKGLDKVTGQTVFQPRVDFLRDLQQMELRHFGVTWDPTLRF